MKSYELEHYIRADNSRYYELYTIYLGFIKIYNRSFISKVDVLNYLGNKVSKYEGTEYYNEEGELVDR